MSLTGTSTSSCTSDVVESTADATSDLEESSSSSAPSIIDRF